MRIAELLLRNVSISISHNRAFHISHVKRSQKTTYVPLVKNLRNCKFRGATSDHWNAIEDKWNIEIQLNTSLFVTT